MFSAVYDTLAAGKAVGIFPEGGSHDQPSLLPLKAGLRSWRSARWRGTPASSSSSSPSASTTFGPPLPLARLPRHWRRARCAGTLLAKYEGGGDEHEATSELMELVEIAVGGDDERARLRDARALRRSRRLTRKRAEPLSLGQQARSRVASPSATTRRRRTAGRGRSSRRCAASARWRRVQLDAQAVWPATQVANVMDNMTRRRAAALVVGRSLQLLLLSATLVPTALLAQPLLLLTRIIAWVKARQAVANSKVKIHGRDVATWKVLISLGVLLLWLFYTGLACALAASSTTSRRRGRARSPAHLLLPPVPLLRRHAGGERVANLARSLPPLVMCVAARVGLPLHRDAIAAQERDARPRRRRVSTTSRRPPRRSRTTCRSTRSRRSRSSTPPRRARSSRGAAARRLDRCRAREQEAILMFSYYLWSEKRAAAAASVLSSRPHLTPCTVLRQRLARRGAVEDVPREGLALAEPPELARHLRERHRPKVLRLERGVLPTAAAQSAGASASASHRSPSSAPARTSSAALARRRCSPS